MNDPRVLKDEIDKLWNSREMWRKAAITNEEKILSLLREVSGLKEKLCGCGKPRSECTRDFEITISRLSAENGELHIQLDEWRQAALKWQERAVKAERGLVDLKRSVDPQYVSREWKLKVERLEADLAQARKTAESCRQAADEMSLARIAAYCERDNLRRALVELEKVRKERDSAAPNKVFDVFSQIEGLCKSAKGLQ